MIDECSRPALVWSSRKTTSYITASFSDEACAPSVSLCCEDDSALELHLVRCPPAVEAKSTGLFRGGSSCAGVLWPRTRVSCCTTDTTTSTTVPAAAIAATTTTTTNAGF